MSEDVIPMVHAFIDSRNDAGMGTYGKPLTTFDGRNTIRDAQEEAGDLLNYLTKWAAEWPVIANLLDQAADFVGYFESLFPGEVDRYIQRGGAPVTADQLVVTAGRMRGDVDLTSARSSCPCDDCKARISDAHTFASAAYRTPAERLAAMHAGGDA